MTVYYLGMRDEAKREMERKVTGGGIVDLWGIGSSAARGAGLLAPTFFCRVPVSKAESSTAAGQTEIASLSDRG